MVRGATLDCNSITGERQSIGRHNEPIYRDEIRGACIAFREAFRSSFGSNTFNSLPTVLADPDYIGRCCHSLWLFAVRARYAAIALVVSHHVSVF